MILVAVWGMNLRQARVEWEELARRSLQPSRSEMVEVGLVQGGRGGYGEKWTVLRYAVVVEPTELTELNVRSNHMGLANLLPISYPFIQI